MGPLAEPKIPAIQGLDDVRGRDVPLRALEPRLRPPRQARRRHRHRRLGDPVRARDPEAGRPGARGPAHRAVGHAAPEPPDPRLGEAPLRPRPGAAEARARRHLRGARAARARLRQEPAADEAARADRPQAHAQPDLRSRSCWRRSRPTTRSAASASCRPTAGTARSRKPNVELLTGGVEKVTRNSVITGDGEEREVDAIIFGTGFQVTDMPVGRMVRGPRRQDARRRLGGQPEGAPRRRDAGLPEPVRPARAEHRPRPLARWST